MKVSELFENQQFKYSPEEIVALPNPHPDNIESAFKVQKVAFNQTKGLGATPNNQNVVYLGFAAEMKPSQFLRVALDADRADDAKKFVGLIRDGVALASPFLEISFNEHDWENGSELRVEVRGHEGRGRVWAIDEVNGNTPLPIHFLVRGARAHNLNEKFFSDLRATGLVKERAGESAAPTPIQFGRIFWNGKVL